MVVPVDVVNAAREGNLDVVAAYFSSEPRDVEDDCESAPGRPMPVPLLSIALSRNFLPSVWGTEGKIRVVKLLLALGADPNRRNGWGYVALACAVSNCHADGTPRMVQVLLDAGADARVMGFDRGGSASLVGCLLQSPGRALIPEGGLVAGIPEGGLVSPGTALVPEAARPFKNHLVVLKMLLRAGSSLDNCKIGAFQGPSSHAESFMDDAETNVLYGSRIATDAGWIAMKAIVAGVRREGSWKAYCRVEHKRLLRLRSYLVRGYAETTDARVDRILRLPNGACWKVLAYWREAA